jgi:hypothetical protein
MLEELLKCNEKNIEMIECTFSYDRNVRTD